MYKSNKKLNMIVQKIASPQIILISFLGFISVMFLVNIIFKQNFNYLTQTFNYSSEYANQLLSDIGSEGRNKHLLVLIPDIIMVMLYTVLLIGSNYAVFSRLTQNCTMISILTFSPILLTIIQFSEIVVLALIISRFPSSALYLASANIITMIKIILTVLCFLIPLLGISILGIKKITTRSRS